jgi:hypothetical protein
LIRGNETILNGENGIGMKVTRVAVADTLIVGGTVLRNVVFLVLPDDRFPTGEHGILGLPVILAVEALRWTADGLFETGFSSKDGSSGKSNLCLDGRWLATETEFQGRKLFLGLDTGSAMTHLYSKFRDDFRQQVKAAGSAETIQDVGAAGGKAEPGIMLTDLPLRLAGFEAALRPAHILSDPTPYPWYHGNLAMDFLLQAREVTLDFRRMTVTLK